MRKLLLSSIGALALAACVSPTTSGPGIDSSQLESERGYQQRLAVQLRLDEEARIDAIAEPVLAANEAFCERKGVWLGVGAHSELDFARQVREVAREQFGYSRALRVSWVAADGPAATAGVMVGDVITAIDGEEVRSRAGAWVEMRRDIESTGLQTPVELTLDRGGVATTAVVQAPRVCGYPVFVNDDSAINAYADGRAIYINRGLINFARSDDEIALVISHELAHNAMGHIEAQRANATAGAVGGALLDIALLVGGVDTGGAFTQAGGDLGMMRFSQDFENEADYVGMYYLARSGRSIDGVEDFWRRAAVENPRSVIIGGTHPTTPERFLRLQAARDEIAVKATAGEELAPNLREGAVEAEEAEEPVDLSDGPPAIR